MIPDQTERARLEKWGQSARDRMDQAGIKDRREVHYVEKEDLMAAIGAAVCQERS